MDQEEDEVGPRTWGPTSHGSQRGNHGDLALAGHLAVLSSARSTFWWVGAPVRHTWTGRAGPGPGGPGPAGSRPEGPDHAGLGPGKRSVCRTQPGAAMSRAGRNGPGRRAGQRVPSARPVYESPAGIMAGVAESARRPDHQGWPSLEVASVLSQPPRCGRSARCKARREARTRVRSLVRSHARSLARSPAGRSHDLARAEGASSKGAGPAATNGTRSRTHLERYANSLCHFAFRLTTGSRSPDKRQGLPPRSCAGKNSSKPAHSRVGAPPAGRSQAGPRPFEINGK